MDMLSTIDFFVGLNCVQTSKLKKYKAVLTKNIHSMQVCFLLAVYFLFIYC